MGEGQGSKKGAFISKMFNLVDLFFFFGREEVVGREGSGGGATFFINSFIQVVSLRVNLTRMSAIKSSVHYWLPIY